MYKIKSRDTVINILNEWSSDLYAGYKNIAADMECFKKVIEKYGVSVKSDKLECLEMVKVKSVYTLN